MYCVLYHEGNVCVYVDKRCIYSAVTFRKGEDEKSIKTLLQKGVDILYRQLIDDYLNHQNEVQQYIDDMYSHG